MEFTATYRSSDGSIAKTVIAAHDRAEVTAILRKRGITPIKVDAERASASIVSRVSLPTILYISAAIVFVGVGGGVWWWMSKGEAKTQTSSTKRIVRPTAHPPPRKITPAPKKAMPPVKEERSLTPDEKRALRSEEMRANRQPPVRKNIEERPDGSFLYTDSKGRRICCLEKHEVVDERNKFRSPFKHKVEAYLSNFAIPGQGIPPMPMMKFSLEEIQASLAEPITIDMDKDDEELIAKKQNVQQIKEFLREAIDQGMTFEEFVQKLEERQRTEAALVKESKAMILKVLAEGKNEEARELLNALNKNLNANGIPNLRLPGAFRRMLENPQ